LLDSAGIHGNHTMTLQTSSYSSAQSPAMLTRPSQENNDQLKCAHACQVLFRRLQDDDGSCRGCSSSITCRSGATLGGNTCSVSHPLASPMLQDQHERSIAQQHGQGVFTIKTSTAAERSKSARADRRRQRRYDLRRNF
jgi:hypothetical protein